MEKRTVVLVIAGLFFLAFIFILMAIFVSEHKIKTKEYLIPESLNSSNCPPDFNPLPVILISLDGFRPDYITRGKTPVIQHLIEKGSSAPYMSSSYPSITFPNHYTLVTGLYPESHGIINNIFDDRATKKKFSYSSEVSQEPFWWRGEPIWNTVVKNGSKSATYFWVGSDMEIGGYRPTYYEKYNISIPFEDRVDQILKWLKLPVEERPVFLSLYFHQPDSAGHTHGIHSEEVNGNLTRVDEMARRLITGLREQNMLNCVNLIFVSDHGMADVYDNLIHLKNDLGELADKVDFQNGQSGGISLKPEFAKNEETAKLEKALTCKQKNMRAFKKEELPLRVHFSRDPNIHDYVLFPRERFTMRLNENYSYAGEHGYDSHSKSMNALFFAYGPSFKAGYRTEPFQNIEIYNLICQLLGVPPAPNNGTRGLLDDILQVPPIRKEDNDNDIQVSFLEDMNSDRFSVSSCPGDQPYEPSLISNLTLNSTVVNQILPWGPPKHSYSHLNIGLLYHPKHITGYSKLIRLPMWTSFVMDATPSGDRKKLPWKSDFRLAKDEAPSCPLRTAQFPQQNFTIFALYPAEFSPSANEVFSTLVTSSLPFTHEALKHWKQFLLSTVPRRLKYSNSAFHVIVGPVFDDNFDGLDDLSGKDVRSDQGVPSHYFAIVTKCKTQVEELGQCLDSELEAMGFVIPQKISINNCLSTEEFALEYSVKIRDIELVTGLKFFSEVPLKTRLKLILREHQQLWPLTKNER